MLNMQSARQLCAAPWILRRRLRDAADLERFPRLLAADLVTLDVFDTALVRTLAHHDDVFALAAWRTVHRRGLSHDVADLVAGRRAAHRRALDAARAAGRDETTIDDIYAHHPIAEPAVRAALLAEELATERDVCRANPPILALYRQLIAAGRRVAFLSDTPFSAGFVRELLRDAGYAGDLEVHVSSAFGTTKAHGALFERVAAATGVPTARTWHIGDNLRSDVLRARESGVAALWYRPRLRKAHPAPADGSAASIGRSVVAGARAALARGDVTTTIGATIAGPVYLAFAQWLINKLRREPVGRVFFLARDAYIMKAFYERLRDPARDPEASYLVVSRRSLVFPLIERLGESELDVLCSHERPLPVRDFLGRIDLVPPADAVARHGLTLDTIVASPADVAALRALFVALGPMVLARAAEERALLLAYLAQEGFAPGRRLALCDVGWNGKSQRALAQVLAADGAGSGLDGYYVGTSEAVRRLGATGGTAAGWLVDDGRPRFGVDVSNLSWVLLELIFSAPHASAIGYAQAAGSVAPVYRDESANPGFQDAVRRIQDGALVFLDAYKRAFGGLAPLAVDEGEAVEALARLVASPTSAEAAALGDITMIEGMGDTRTGYAIAKPPSWRAVAGNPKALAAAYRATLWRRGFAVRLLRSRRLAGALYGGLERLRLLREGASAAPTLAARPAPAAATR